MNPASPPCYIYDGTLMGFYCCVYESVYARETPMEIAPEHLAQPNLFTQKYIVTDAEKARRVRSSIPNKICLRARELVETVFLSCLAQKEIKLLRYLLLGYSKGKKIHSMLSHPDVDALLKAERHLLGERHLLLGFIRFSDYGGMLAATITPKNFVLPFLAEHFCSRYSNENFLIYDKTHGAALIYHAHKQRIVDVEDMRFDAPSETEEQYRALWKRFYDTIAIKGRYNPKCRMTHMPKRYWENMLEMQESL